MRQRADARSGRRIPGSALIVVVAVALTSATGVAPAQNPNAERPSSSAPVAAPQAEVATPGSAPSSDAPDGLRSNIGDLPFTGLDLMILAGLAMVLFGTGIALRRLSAPRVYTE